MFYTGVDEEESEKILGGVGEDNISPDDYLTVPFNPKYGSSWFPYNRWGVLYS
jgi:hypothetical protein